MELRTGVILSTFLILISELAPSLAQNCPTVVLKNGRVRVRSRGRMVHFRCSRGFSRVGQRFAVCLKSGQWSQQTPVCVGRGCPKLKDLPNLKWQKMYAGGVLKFTCEVGLRSGPEQIMCDGTNWDQEPPKCLEGMSLGCDFEDEALCGWSNDNDDDFDWTWNKGQTPTGNTGPQFDHTKNNSQGHYIFVESSAPQQNGYKAKFVSPTYSPDEVENLCLEFFYHMYGHDDPGEVGELDVYMMPLDTLQLTDDQRIFHRHGNQGDRWARADMEIPKVSSKFKFVFQATRLRGWSSDIALDDIRIYNCSENPFATKQPPTTVPVISASSPMTTPKTTESTTKVTTHTTSTTTSTTPTTTSTTTPTTTSTTTPTTTSTTTPTTTSTTPTTTTTTTTPTTTTSTTTTATTTTTTTATTTTPTTTTTTSTTSSTTTPPITSTTTSTTEENTTTPEIMTRTPFVTSTSAGRYTTTDDDYIYYYDNADDDDSDDDTTPNAEDDDDKINDEDYKDYIDLSDKDGHDVEDGEKDANFTDDPNMPITDIAVNNNYDGDNNIGDDGTDDNGDEYNKDDTGDSQSDLDDKLNGEETDDDVSIGKVHGASDGKSSSASGSSAQIPLIIGVIAAVIVGAVAIAAAAYLVSKRQRRKREEKEADDQMNMIVDYGETSLNT